MDRRAWLCRRHTLIIGHAAPAHNAAGIPHAVLGGHAVAAWVARIDPAAVRTTVDVDILISRADFARTTAALEAAGFIHSFTFGIHIFVDGPQGKAREAIHILFAGEPVKPVDPVPAPNLSPIDIHEGYRIVELDQLITMKLTASRLKDRVHLLDMIDVGLIDAGTVARLPPPLRPRLEQLLANPDGCCREDPLSGVAECDRSSWPIWKGEAGSWPARGSSRS